MGAMITVGSVIASVLPVHIWLQFDPVIDVTSVYVSCIVLPAIIAPTCSFFVLRTRMKAESLARENHRLANVDELTDLPNRRAFFAATGALQGQAGNGQLYCAIADIDNFKQVNNEFGHEAGDAVLKSFGITVDDKGRVVVDAQRKTSRDRVWAGGDCVNGGKEIVNAAEDGKQAARAIHASLR